MAPQTEPVLTADMVMSMVATSSSSAIGGRGWVPRVAYDLGSRPEALRAAIDTCVERGWLIADGPELWRATDAGKIQIDAIRAREATSRAQDDLSDRVRFAGFGIEIKGPRWGDLAAFIVLAMCAVATLAGTYVALMNLLR